MSLALTKIVEQVLDGASQQFKDWLSTPQGNKGKLLSEMDPYEVELFTCLETGIITCEKNGHSPPSFSQLNNINNDCERHAANQVETAAQVGTNAGEAYCPRTRSKSKLLPILDRLREKARDLGRSRFETFVPEQQIDWLKLPVTVRAPFVPLGIPISEPEWQARMTQIDQDRLAEKKGVLGMAMASFLIGSTVVGGPAIFAGIRTLFPGSFAGSGTGFMTARNGLLIF